MEVSYVTQAKETIPADVSSGIKLRFCTQGRTTKSFDAANQAVRRPQATRISHRPSSLAPARGAERVPLRFWAARAKRRISTTWVSKQNKKRSGKKYDNVVG